MGPPRPASVTLEIDVAALTGHGADAKDAELAAEVVKAANQLREAMDTAARAGLILEPSFESYATRATEYGSDTTSFVCKIGVYRRLV